MNTHHFTIAAVFMLSLLSHRASAQEAIPVESVNVSSANSYVGSATFESESSDIKILEDSKHTYTAPRIGIIAGAIGILGGAIMVGAGAVGNSFQDFVPARFGRLSFAGALSIGVGVLGLIGGLVHLAVNRAKNRKIDSEIGVLKKSHVRFSGTHLSIRF